MNERPSSSGPRLDDHVVRGLVRRAPVLAVVTVAMALGSGPALTAVAATSDDASIAAKHGKEGKGDQGSGHDHEHGPDNGTGVDVEWGDDDTDESGKGVENGRWKADRDLGSYYNLTGRIGAQDAWQRGITGRGVTVAVIDTGVAPVEGLDGAGKVVNGPDLSYESQRDGTRYLDGFGHGTHMAGIIAGRDDKLKLDKKKVDPKYFAGVAPEAGILNMKVATGDGGTDVTSVIAAIDWVVQHRQDRGMNVRVISLSYGTSSTQGADTDPLARAVENAWEHGIVVVASAGNDGLASSSLLMPAVDPYVIAVGAVDHLGTASTSDDVVADFTNGGDATRRPDLVAPGKSVVSLRVPGSYVDQLHPEGRIPGDKDERFLRGSGTSQATAVVSGAVALLLQQRPELTPDQVKAILRESADPLAGAQPAQGSGVLDVDGALDTRTPDAGAVAQTWPRSTGLGSLDASRGGEHVIDPATGQILAGERDALGDPFDAAAWVAESSAGQAWSGGTWGERAWTGDFWSLNGWAPTQWTGLAWSGVAWDAHTWSDAYWEARSWRDDSWLARSWRGGTWEARSWREDSWVARSWRSDSWVARSWRGLP
jgi:serine protease AprX